MTYAELRAELVPDGWCWRTSQESLLPTEVRRSTKSSERWPKTGSLRDGHVYELPTLALPTIGSVGSVLPTPTAVDMGRGKSVEEWDDWTEAMRDRHGNGNGHGRSLEIEAARLLPTPTCQDGANNGGPSQFRRHALPLNTLVTTFPDSDPTPMPSPDGNLLSDDQPPAPPTTSDDSTQPSSNG